VALFPVSLRTYLFSVCCDVRVLHSFPTRRSSDLARLHGRELTRVVPIISSLAAQQAIVLISYGFASRFDDGAVTVIGIAERLTKDRKSTRLNSSHVKISYAVFCLKKKNVKPSDPH